MIQGTKSDALKQIEDYFNWTNVLQQIRIASSGSVLAVAEKDGTVLSFKERQAEGSSVEELGVQFRGEKAPASLDRLLAAFSDPKQVAEIEIAGTDYYASRVNVDHVLMLALLPVDEALSSAKTVTGAMFFLTFLVTGLCVIYACIHIQDKDQNLKNLGRYQWFGSLAGRMTVCAVLAVIAVFQLSLYLGALSTYAESFYYCQNEVSSVVDQLGDNNDTLDVLQKWSDEEYLTKCRIAGCFLAYMDQEDVTRQYLAALSDRLAVKCIYVFDREGNVFVTDSPYDSIRVDQDSPLYPLLEGRPSLACEPGVDALSGEYLQLLGVSLRDQDNERSGFLAVAVDPAELKTISDNLDADNVFQQVCLTDDSFVMVVDGEDMVIKYIAEVKGSQYETGLDSYDYTGMPVSVLDIDEERLKDNFNGNLFVMDSKYFASVRRSGDDYLLVMKPNHRIDKDQMISIAWASALTVAFLLLLVPLTCIEKKETQAPPREAPDPQSAETGSAGKAQERRSLWKDAIGSSFSSLMDSKKPYFEERWPGDGKRWSEKTPNEKFALARQWTIVLAFAAIVLYVILAGDRTFWDYCLNGEWDTGINLYSITTCVITICILILVKIAGHRLLFVIARAVGAKGETICHLIDSSLGYALVIAGFFICLSNLGVNTTTLSLTGGVAGLIFGIGCQNIVADILAGIIIALESVVHVGDFVSYNGNFGTVVSIGVRTTQLKWINEVTIVRNNEFKNYVNMTNDVDSRVISTISIDLKKSLEQVEAIVRRELPALHERLCEDKKIGYNVDGPYYRGVQKIDENGMRLAFGVYCPGWQFGWVSRGMNRELKLMCERNGIRLALPQIVINDPNGSGSIPDSSGN